MLLDVAVIVVCVVLVCAPGLVGLLRGGSLSAQVPLTDSDSEIA